MLFNSLEFAVFLVIVLAAHFLLLPAKAVRGRKVLLLVSSYLFYASWNPFFTLLLFFSTAVDFAVGLGLERERRPATRRALLLLSLATNLGLLGFFKYGAFFADNALALWGGSAEGLDFLRVALPVGISFYTFQSLSYSIDVYRRVQRATRNPLDFVLYVSFFPQLVAGPIVRAGQLLPQLAGARRTTAEDVEIGWMRIAAGLVKKVVLADTLGAYVDAVFESPAGYGGPQVAIAIYAFAFQIYLDFSGYCDIAIGVARLLGVRLPENFDRPYLATNVQDFWRRWHITLSTWLRDYVYVSLGGNRNGRVGTLWNLLATMLLGGLWHGAGWAFVLWGAYHGALLAAHRVIHWSAPDRTPRLPAWARRFATFHLVCAGWILFRAPTLEVAGDLVARLSHGGLGWSFRLAQVTAALAIVGIVHVGTRSRGLGAVLLGRSGWLQGAAYAAVVIIVYLASGRTHEFIYFQF